MCDKLAKTKTVPCGVYTYEITAAGGKQTPPQYTVSVHRREGDGEPELVGQITMTGILMHQFVENSDLVDHAMGDIEAAIPH